MSQPRSRPPASDAAARAHAQSWRAHKAALRAARQLAVIETPACQSPVTAAEGPEPKPTLMHSRRPPGTPADLSLALAPWWTRGSHRRTLGVGVARPAPAGGCEEVGCQPRVDLARPAPPSEPVPDLPTTLGSLAEPVAAAPLLPLAASDLPSGRPSPAHHIGFLRAAMMLTGVAAAVTDWKQANILVDSGSQQKDLVSEDFARRLGVQGTLTGAAAQADGTLIPLYDVGNLQLAVNGVPTWRRFQRANIAPYDVILGEQWCEAESAVLDYANAALWSLQPGRGLLPLVLNAKPEPAVCAAESFLATHGSCQRPLAPAPALAVSTLATDDAYQAAAWAARQRESAVRVQQILASGPRMGAAARELLTKSLPTAAAASLPGSWPAMGPTTSGAHGSRLHRLQRRHDSRELERVRRARLVRPQEGSRVLRQP